MPPCTLHADMQVNTAILGFVCILRAANLNTTTKNRVTALSTRVPLFSTAARQIAALSSVVLTILGDELLGEGVMAPSWA